MRFYGHTPDWQTKISSCLCEKIAAFGLIDNIASLSIVYNRKLKWKDIKLIETVTEVW